MTNHTNWFAISDLLITSEATPFFEIIGKTMPGNRIAYIFRLYRYEL